MKKGLLKKISLVLFVLAIAVSCASVEKPGYFAVEGVDLSTSEIISVYPLNVMPGTLVSVTGQGFGVTPGYIYVGGVPVDSFYGWSDSVIWFRMPEGVPDEAEVIVGESVSEDYMYQAPEGSLTVVFQVDAGYVQELSNMAYTNYGMDYAPEWQYPIYIKGEWIKSGESFGNSAVGEWDGGSRAVMFNKPETNVWISETVFTPDNMESFGRIAMKFAFEDENIEDRILSSYESDISFMLKKEWAMADGFPSVSSDPVTKINGVETADGVLLVNFPITE